MAKIEKEYALGVAIDAQVKLNQREVKILKEAQAILERASELWRKINIEDESEYDPEQDPYFVAEVELSYCIPE